MSQQERVTAHFARSARDQTEAGENLSTEICLAAERMVQSLLQGGKILTCGNGACSALSQYLCTLLLNRYQRERPGLPAIALDSDACTLNAIALDHHVNEVFSRQIRTLGQEGDTLILIANSHNSPAMQEVISASRDRGLQLIVLDDEDSMHISDLLESEDIEIRAPATSAAGCQEVHLSMIHCLCDLIDVLIFGEEL